MKAIILGAGSGSRLLPITQEIPKCLIDGLGGRRLMDWIIDALSTAGTDDIIFVGGYQYAAVSKGFPQLTLIHNEQWETTGLLHSLFAAEEFFGDGFIVSYADIVYRTHLVQRLIEADADVAIVVDRDWRRRYTGRQGHSEADAERVVSQNGLVQSVGKSVPVSDADGEFIGLAKFSGAAIDFIRSDYSAALAGGLDVAFAHAKSFRYAYLTDLMELLLARGVPISVVETWGDWVEINTAQDLAFGRQLLADAPGDHMSREFWATRAQHYADLEWASSVDYLDTVLNAAEPTSDDRVLDVGTGTGIVAKSIAPRVHDVIGVDISPDMLSRAMEARPSNVAFEQGDVRKLAFPSAHFDKVIARMIFHHVMPDPALGLSECYRVLRPGGLMILSEGTPPDAYLKTWYTEMFALKEERLTFLESDLVELLFRTGFEIHSITRHVAAQVSIRNWLESSGLDSEIQAKIFQMHLELDEQGKRLYNMKVTSEDILCDFVFVNAVGRRPLKG